MGELESLFGIDWILKLCAIETELQMRITIVAGAKPNFRKLDQLLIQFKLLKVNDIIFHIDLFILGNIMMRK